MRSLMNISHYKRFTKQTMQVSKSTKCESNCLVISECTFLYNYFMYIVSLKVYKIPL